MRGVLTVLSLTAECSPRQQIIEELGPHIGGP